MLKSFLKEHFYFNACRYHEIFHQLSISYKVSSVTATSWISCENACLSNNVAYEVISPNCGIVYLVRTWGEVKWGGRLAYHTFDVRRDQAFADFA